MSNPEKKDIASEAVALAAHIEAEGELADEDVVELQKLHALLEKHLPKKQKPGITRVRFDG
jgi:hypothetical protein